MSTTWIKWAFGEVVFRSISLTLQKIIGGIGGNLPLMIFSTAVIGFVQTIASGILLNTKEISPFVGTRQIAGSILFGFGAFVNTVLAFHSVQQNTC